MKPTSVSLLDRLKVARREASDWSRLQEIGQPLIQRWLGRVPGLVDESPDLVQEVFIVVFREIPRFDRRREGSVRAWPRRRTDNRIRTYSSKRRRIPAAGLDSADGFLERPSAPDDNLARGRDQDHDKHVVHSLLAQPTVSLRTRAAIQRFTVDGIPATRVAEEVGLSENAVILAKSRILNRLRQAAGDLLC